MTGAGKEGGRSNSENFQTQEKRKIHFTVIGEPVAKARPRVTRNGAVYTPKKTADYEHLIKLVLNASMPLKTPLKPPLRAEIVFTFSGKKKRLGFKVTRADIDNLVKSVLDACNKLAYEDDAGIAVLVARKVWGDEAKTEVTFEEL